MSGIAVLKFFTIPENWNFASFGIFAQILPHRKCEKKHFLYLIVAQYINNYVRISYKYLCNYNVQFKYASKYDLKKKKL